MRIATLPIVALLATLSVSARAEMLVGSVAFSGVTKLNQTTGADDGTLLSGYGQLSGMAIGPNGKLFVANYSSSNPVIYEFDPITGSLLSTFAIDPLSNGLIADIAFGKDGNLYAMDINNQQVLEFNGSTGAFIGEFLSGGHLGFAYPIAFEPNGDLLAGDQNNANIEEFSPAGVYIRTLPGFVSQPTAIAVDPTGRIIEGGAFGDIHLWTGASYTLIYSPASTDTVNNLVYGPDGNFYWTTNESWTVRKLNGTTYAASIFATNDSSNDLVQPFGIAFPSASAPEPGTWLLLAAGLAWMVRRAAQTARPSVLH